MKANRKFIKNDDEAVSPVIATILMVAITVVLGATVYVWVSGFGASGKQAPQMSVSKLSVDTTNFYATYQVSSISDSNVAWTDLEFRVDGDVKNLATTGSAADLIYKKCATPSYVSGNLEAGEQFCFKGSADPSGSVLTITHKDSGTVVVTVTI